MWAVLGMDCENFMRPFRSLRYASHQMILLLTFAIRILSGMKCFIPNRAVRIGNWAWHWFDASCTEALKRKWHTDRTWVAVRKKGDPSTPELRKRFNAVTKFSKKSIARAKMQHIRKIVVRLVNLPSESRAFWSLAKAVEATSVRLLYHIFCFFTWEETVPFIPFFYWQTRKYALISFN